MVQLDERLLEYLAAEGPRKLYPMQAGLMNVSYGLEYPAEYILYRCKRLRQRGLLEYRDDGTYAVTRRGRQFLAGDLDVEDARTRPAGSDLRTDASADG
jgi:hypothetical protein